MADQPSPLVVNIVGNLAQLKASLLQGNDVITTTASAMGRLATAYDPTAFVARANATVAAIDKIGGALMLTDEQQARVNKTVNDGIDAYDRLGRQAPSAMVSLAASTKEASDRVNEGQERVSGLTGLVERLTERAIIYEAVHKAFDISKELIESSVRLVELSEKTGISLDGLQRMSFVAKQSGTDVGAFSDIVFKLGTNVAKGGADVEAAVSKMGLSWTAFRALPIEDKFNTVVEHMDKLGPAGERNRDLVALFGKGVGDTVAAMVDKYKELADQAPIAGDAQVRAVKAAADAWEGLKSKAEVTATNMVGGLALLTKAATDNRVSWGDWLAAVVSWDGSAQKALFTQMQLRTETQRHTDTVLATSDADKAAAAAKSYFEQATLQLDASTRKSIQSMVDAGASTAEVENALKRAGLESQDYTVVVEKLVKAHAAQVEAQKTSTEASVKFAAAVAELQSSGEGWKGTLQATAPALVSLAEGYLRGGVSAGALKITLGLTDAQLKAMTEDIRDHDKALTLHERQIETLKQIEDEYYKTVNASSHDTLGRQIADAYLAADARIAALKKAQTYTVEAEQFIRAQADQTAANILQKSLESDVHTREHFQLLADQAQIAYDFALAHATDFSAGWIDQLRQTATEARVTADSWSTSLGGALDTVTTKAKQTKDAATDMLDVFKSTLPGVMAAPWYIDPTKAPPGSWLVSPYTDIPVSQRPPGRATGGPVSAGETYTVGERGPETFVPSSNGSIVPNGAGGGVTINVGGIHVTQPLGTPEQIAQVVGAAFAARMRALGMRVPYGL